MNHIALVSLFALTCCISEVRAAEAPPADKPVTCWVQSSLVRVYPASKAPEKSESLRIPAARNGRVSFQACVRSEQTHVLHVRCDVTPDPELKLQVRRVGFVPMSHHTTDTPVDDLDGRGFMPGLVPDPLFAEQVSALGPGETQPFWISVRIPADAKPGPHALKVKFDLGDKKVEELAATVDVSELVIQPRKDFPVTHWWRPEAIWDYYKTGMWEDEKLWTLMEAYLRNYVDHGNDVVFVPLFFSRRETFKRPSQLLKITSPTPGKYDIDWTQAQRFIDLARKCGIERFEWPHMWIYWGVENPIRVYTWQSGKAEMLWPPNEPATSERYLTFLRQFFPQFHEFLKKNQLLDKSYYHLSDEPGGDQHVANYKRARAVLDELAPWQAGRIMDALSDIRYGREHLTDIPIPMVNAAGNYIKEGIPHWVYFCCAPRDRWLNRFMDTPLAKVRMSGWTFYHLGAKGFLHWGYNYWHFMETERVTDPFTMSTGGAWPDIPHGDPFVVYPGPDGPIDSIRWEVFAESLQDYAILQSAGVKRDDPMFSDVKSYADFPRDSKWIESRLASVLKLEGTASK